MALFDNIRSKTDTTTARVLFGAVIVVFVFSFINMGFGGRTATYATVNGTRITDLDLQKKMRMVQRQQQNSSLNKDELDQLKESVLEQLIVDYATLDQAEVFGIEVSDTEVNLLLIQNPAFQDKTGAFSEEEYENAIKREGYGNKNKFQEIVREDLTFSKLQNLVTQTVYVSDTEARKIAQEQLTSLSLEWIRLSPSMIEISVEDAEIQTILENQIEELQNEYQADLSRKYQLPQRVDLRQIVMPFTNENKDSILAKMQEIQGKATSENFQDLVNEYNPQALNFGMISDANQSQLDTVIAEAIFGNESTMMTDVLESQNAFYLIQVLDRKPEHTLSFDEVKKDIATAKAQKAKEDAAVKTEAQNILSAWKSEEGMSLEMKAKYPMDSAMEVSLMNPQLPGAGNSPELISALGSISQTGLLDKVYPTTGGYLVVNVTAVSLPTEEQLAKSTTMMKSTLTRMRSEELWQYFQQNARSSANISEPWKQWQ